MYIDSYDVMMFISVANLICSAFILHKLYVTEQPIHFNEHVDSSADSVVQDHVFEREEAYDVRINRMKEELAEKWSRPGSVITVDTGDAPEFHPSVKNLPHNTINHMTGKEKPEYAE